MRLSSCLALSLIFAAAFSTPAFAAEKAPFTVTIEQDGKTVAARRGIVRLKRAPFAIRLQADDSVEIFELNASLSSHIFRQTLAGAPASEIEPFMEAHGMAEGGPGYPIEKALYIDTRLPGSHYLYRPRKGIESDSRFHAYEETAGGWTGTREVESVRIVRGTVDPWVEKKQRIRMSEMRAPLYLSVLVSDAEREEAGRAALKLLFR